jgi:FkbM family methyltransferase
MVYQKLQELINPGCTIIEIGAHIGTDTIKLYRKLEPVRYFAIEPVYANINWLIRLIVKEKLSGITLIPCAIGIKDGYVPFYFSGGKAPGHKRRHTDSSSLMQPAGNIKQRPWMTFEKSMVECQRLDTVYRQYLKDAVIDLIWMDVQGAEFLVIEGGREALARTRYLYTECQEKRYLGQPGLVKIQAALPGWETILKDGDNVLLRRNL